mgnify:CR=1 FL=1
MSAHHTPERVREYAEKARERGIEVLIAAAGGSAALGGVLASWTTLPVIGVPLASSELKGMDSLMTIAQMPPGIPVACMAVGTWGARNSAYFAADILGLKYENIRQLVVGVIISLKYLKWVRVTPRNSTVVTD